MESAEQAADNSSGSNEAVDHSQQLAAADPDVTEDEMMEGDSGLGDGAEATAEGDNDVDGANDESTSATTAASSSAATAKRAPPRKRKSKSQGWGVSAKKKKKSQLSWQERKARIAAKAAAATAVAGEDEQTTEAHLDDAQQRTATDEATEAADEPTVKQEAMEDEAAEEEAASEAATTAAESEIEKTERGRPLRASIKARQKQLEEERKLEEEGRMRRRQEKLLAQARSKTRVKKEEPATPTATQPLSLSAQPPPLSSLSSLPSSSHSSSHPPPPPPPPALLSSERDKSRVVPSHCYGADWRCVAKLTDCIYTQLHSSHSSVIDWSAVSAMMANVSPLSSDECRLLWRCVAYGMDDDGYGRWKRLDPDYEDEADSDIDVELPGYDETGAADVRTIIKSSQLRHCSQENAMDGWTAQHDYALLHVLATWATKSKQQLQTPAAVPTPPPRISLSLTSPPLSAAALPHLPSLDADWQYIAGLFQHFAATHKSHTFLQARFAALTRMAFTVDGVGEGGKEERVRLRERVLAVLGVSAEAEGREWLLHSGGRNWDEKRAVIDRRQRKHRHKRKMASGAANGQNHAAVSTNHAARAAADQAVQVEEKPGEAPMDADLTTVDVDGNDAKSDSADGAAETVLAGAPSNSVNVAEAATAGAGADGKEEKADESESAPMQLTESDEAAAQ